MLGNFGEFRNKKKKMCIPYEEHNYEVLKFSAAPETHFKSIDKLRWANTIFCGLDHSPSISGGLLETIPRHM